MSRLTLKIFVHEGGKAPQKGKEGDAGLDAFACLPVEANLDLPSRDFKLMVEQFQSVKVPLGFSYSFWVDGAVCHDYWLDLRNRSGVGTKSGMVTVAEVGDANYRGIMHYCAVKVTPGVYAVEHGSKLAQLLITPFVDPYKVNIEVVATIEELGASNRGATGFGASGK